MIDELQRKQILKEIALEGGLSSATKQFNLIIATKEHRNTITTRSSGRLKLKTAAVNQANLIISQPRQFSILNPFEIRCCICSKVIGYPAWQYSIQYVVNQIHYFICFDGSNPSKPNTACYKGD